MLHGRSAGNWLFCHRRWLDPRIPEERQILDSNYDGLCATFPGFATCSKADYIKILADVCEAWSSRAGEPEPSVPHLRSA